ncbi:MAG: hypothetical protein II965_04520 [Pyramidobacter sp.]|nr:hypothetical protein [Pyramidobacter sp.]
MNTNKKISAFWCLLILAGILSLPSVLWRTAHERNNRSALVLFDLLELHALKADTSATKFQALMESGITAFLAPEFTAEELRKACLKTSLSSLLPN